MILDALRERNRELELQLDKCREDIVETREKISQQHKLMLDDQATLKNGYSNIDHR